METKTEPHVRNMAVEGELPLPPGLLEAFLDYDQALLANDTERVNGLFADSPFTLRATSRQVIVGSESIASSRAKRQGAPTRHVVKLHVRRAGEAFLLQAETVDPEGRARGVQTQLWLSVHGAWRVLAAHVSSAVPEQALDTRVWRCVGAPLVRGANQGALRGIGVAVKDLYAVAGFPVGAGVPRYLSEAKTASEHAAAVKSLLDAGADVTGIAQTDQFAFSLAGQNTAWGTPVNPLRPGSVPGGSTSGPATAVALGQAALGLGTDTAGSIRIPSSYQSLWGIRSTHGLIDRRGLLQLAETFDTVGLISADPGVLELALTALIPEPLNEQARVDRVIIFEDLQKLAAPLMAERVEAAAGLLSAQSDAQVVHSVLPDGLLSQWFRDFRLVQAAEAWGGRGDWICKHPGALSPEIEQRFRSGSRLDPVEVARARSRIGRERQRLRSYMENAVLALPAASSAPPKLTASAAEVEQTRNDTLHLTCFAGVGGLPALSAPIVPRLDIAKGAEEPGNVCIVGAAGTDHALVRLCHEAFGTRL